MSELKACPFCLSEEIDPTGWRDDQGRQGPECENCGATARSVFDWNRRAPLPTEPRVSVGPVTVLGTASPERPNVTGRALPTVTREELAQIMCERNGNKCACATAHATTGWCFDGSWASGTTPASIADAVVALLREKGVIA